MKRRLLLTAALLVSLALLTSCASPEPETVVQTIVVENEVPVAETVRVEPEKSVVEVWRNVSMASQLPHG